MKQITIMTDKNAELIAKGEPAAQLLQERRTALISAAVTGEIDVRHWQPPVVSQLETTATAHRG